MIKILGIELGTFLSRLATAVLYGFVSLVIFLFIPETLLGGSANALGISTSLFFNYAVLIVILSGLQGIFKDRFLGDAATVANGFTQIYYLFLITNGGIINYFVAQQGINLTIDFRTIMYLLVLPSAFTVINAVIHASARVSAKPLDTTQEIVTL